MAIKGIGRVQIEISKPARQRIGAGALVILAVLGWAWWDGGEEPMHPIAKQIDLPEAPQ